MLRRLLFAKHFLYALFALVGALCACEVVLQFREVQSLASRDSKQPACISWSHEVHHKWNANTKITVRHPDSGAKHEVRFNSFGLRGAEIPLVKPPRTLRVLFLGDDTVAGLAMPEGHVVTSRLSQMLKDNLQRDVEVLNGGVPGYCPLLSYLQFRHRLAQLQPDLIVLGFDMSDVADDARYRRRLQLGTDGEPSLCTHPALAAAGKKSKFCFVDHFVLTRIARSQLDTFFSTNPGSATDIHSRHLMFSWLADNAPNWDSYIEKSFKPIEQLAAAAQALSVPIVLTVCPAPWQVSALACSAKVREQFGVPGNTRYGSRIPFETLQAFAFEKNIPFCDPSRAFLSINENHRLFLMKSRQLSKYGHSLYAKELARFITDTISFAPEAVPERPGYLTRPLATTPEPLIQTR